MIKILLVCSEGMSTSLLAKRMEEAANKLAVDVTVSAVSSSVAKSCINDYDCVILGPQVRFMLKKIAELVEDKSKPVYAADMRAYGTVNGKFLLQEALGKLGK